ncbi:MAG: AIR synthase-related protein, partial [Spirochaetota bacterium]
VMRDLQNSCTELNVSVIGGHTEVTPGLSHPILSGAMLGEAGKDQLIKNGNITPGDRLYLTKAVAIEATSIIARDKKSEVINKFGSQFYRRCLNFLENPGISVVRDAIRARSEAGITGMHDPTEGGVLAGAYEMAVGSGLGLRIFLDKIPVFQETRKLCEYFKISPYQCIASGSLLISAPPGEVHNLERAFSGRADGMPYLSCIGEFTRRGEPTVVEDAAGTREIHPTGRDDITRIL